MKSFNTNRILLLLGFGFIVYLLNIFCLPLFGMLISQMISAGLLLLLLGTYIFLAGKESDERERHLQLQADSAALYVVIAGLLAAAIFYPHSQVAMVFWFVLGLVIVGKVITFFYQR